MEIQDSPYKKERAAKGEWDAGRHSGRRDNGRGHHNSSTKYVARCHEGEESFWWSEKKGKLPRQAWSHETEAKEREKPTTEEGRNDRRGSSISGYIPGAHKQ